MSDKPKQKTRAQLEGIIAALNADLGRIGGAKASQYTELQSAIAREKETRLQFDDLKERLANAESENQRLRGYIARVQEDDVAREELVTIGDPAGEQQLVPKRKPTLFQQPSGYSQLSMQNDCSYSAQRDRPKPRHWVTY